MKQQIVNKTQFIALNQHSHLTSREIARLIHNFMMGLELWLRQNQGHLFISMIGTKINEVEPEEHRFGTTAQNAVRRLQLLAGEIRLC